MLASSALGVWRWTSFRNTSEYLFQWQLITLLGFYLLALAVGAWMVPSNLAGLDTAVLVLDTLIVLALLLRLLTTLESPSDYEQIGYAKTPPVQHSAYVSVFSSSRRYAVVLWFYAVGAGCAECRIGSGVIFDENFPILHRSVQGPSVCPICFPLCLSAARHPDHALAHSFLPSGNSESGRINVPPPAAAAAAPSSGIVPPRPDA